jgi:hypothetical protein
MEKLLNCSNCVICHFQKTLDFLFILMQSSDVISYYNSLAHDSELTLVCAEYGYLKGSPNTNSYRRNPPLQLSIQRFPQHIPNRPSSEPHESTRQQAIAKTPAQ